jgi:hypothetical protein
LDEELLFLDLAILVYECGTFESRPRQGILWNTYLQWASGDCDLETSSMDTNFPGGKIRRRDRESRDEEKAKFLEPSSKRTGLLMVELERGKQSKCRFFPTDVVTPGTG